MTLLHLAYRAGYRYGWRRAECNLEPLLQIPPEYDGHFKAECAFIKGFAQGHEDCVDDMEVTRRLGLLVEGGE
jgi:hypothetical protein